MKWDIPALTTRRLHSRFDNIAQYLILHYLTIFLGVHLRVVILPGPQARRLSVKGL